MKSRFSLTRRQAVVGIGAAALTSRPTRSSAQDGQTDWGSWPSFRNGGNNQTDGVGNPVVVGQDAKPLWTADIPGYGQSSPVLTRDRIYVTSVRGALRETNLVSCLDAGTGKLLWTRESTSALQVDSTEYVSRAAPTPVADPGGVVAYFESGDVAAYSSDGTPRWQRNFTGDYGKPENEFGLGSSPAQTDNLAVLVLDDANGAYITALVKSTGKTAWKTDREKRKAWSSPIIVRQGDHDVAVVSANGSVDGYDVRSGEPLWSVDRLSGNIIASVVHAAGHLFIGASTAQRQLAKQGGRTPAESNCCIRLTERNGKPSAELAWEGKKPTCDFASPVVHKGLVYSLSGPGLLSCVDASNGEVVYSERVDAGQCWATPLVWGDHILVAGKTGTVSVVKTGRKFEVAGNFRLWPQDSPPKPKEAVAIKDRPGAPSARIDPAVYAVLGAKGRLYVRLGSHLQCFKGL